MEQTTYRKLAELTRDLYYKGIPSDDAKYSLRFFAEQIAQEVAEMATMNAIENSNQGESTYANDQFISTFTNLPILQNVDGTKSTLLPSTPTAMPNNQEISQVKITGSTCMDCIPMTSRSYFSQQLIGWPLCMVFYKIEGESIVFESSNTLLEGTVSIKMIGAVSGQQLLDSALNIPKNYEGRITSKILARLLPLKREPIDYVNDSISNPS